MKKVKIFFWAMIISTLFPMVAISEVLIIANPSVRESTLTKKNVQMIFLGRIKKWEDGKKIRIAALKKGVVHETFLSAFVEKSSDRFASFWKIATVSGTGYPPKYFENEADLVKYVAGNEGSVGYISPDTPHGSVKVISTQ